MARHPWVKEFPVAVTVSDRNGIILEMNDASAVTFAEDGGSALIGKSSLACHPEPARSKFEQLLKEPQPNIYTIEKAGVKKLIAQIPWYREGEFSGVVELSIRLPEEVPHFVRG